MLLNMSMVYKCFNYKYAYTLFLNYKVLAPPSLMCKSISLVGIRELRATSCGGSHLQNLDSVILEWGMGVA